MVHKINSKEDRIEFSFKREVFFIVVGGIMGAIVMAIPFTFPFTGRGSGYAFTWIVFGHVVGVHSPVSSAIIAGILIHIVTGISIGIVSGIILYKTKRIRHFKTLLVQKLHLLLKLYMYNSSFKKL
jgi:FtsH-binding integral membrane protein